MGYAGDSLVFQQRGQDPTLSFASVNPASIEAYEKEMLSLKQTWRRRKSDGNC